MVEFCDCFLVFSSDSFAALALAALSALSLAVCLSMLACTSFDALFTDLSHAFCDVRSLRACSPTTRNRAVPSDASQT